jgi:hypothetical protein
MDAGYDAPDAFARAFRRRFGQSPSSFRKSPDWVPWLAAFGPLDNARSKLMQIIFTPDDVAIRDVPPTPVAIMEHRGDRATLGDTIQRFIAWRKAAGLSPETSATFNGFPVGAVSREPRRLQHGPVCRVPTSRSRRRRYPDEGRRHPRRTLRGAALVPAIPTISSPPRSTSIASGFRPAAWRKRATPRPSRSIAGACAA